MKEITAAIAKVMGSVGYVQKKGTNTFHNYKFAAIGDILAKIQPAMVDAGLVISQSEVCHELIAEGSVMTATYEFALSHTSGESWPDKPRHTGMAGARNSKGGFDDKALNKCHTAARKYFLLGLFQIPTGDVADPDEDGDPVPKNGNGAHAPTPQQEPAKRATKPPAPEDEARSWAEWATTYVNTKITTPSALRKWELQNEANLSNLKLLDRPSWADLNNLLEERHSVLTTAQVSA